MHPQHLNKSCKIHNINNAWQNLFSAALSVVMQYTNQSHLKVATTVSDPPHSSPLLAVLKCLKDNVKCGPFCSGSARIFSYGFTGLESKYFCWHFATLIQEPLKISSLSKGSVVKLHTGICWSQIQRCSFCLLKSWGVH